jgi:hypothetical protein
MGNQTQTRWSKSTVNSKLQRTKQEIKYRMMSVMTVEMICHRDAQTIASMGFGHCLWHIREMKEKALLPVLST